jgi:hypothetical protein
MMNRIRSSRQLEAASYNRIDVIWLLSGQHPDHSTISGFVKAHGKRLRGLFRDVLQVALRAGLVKLDHVAIDGTKIEADASRGSVRSEASLAKEFGALDEKISALEAEWSSNEARESNLFGEEVPWAPGGSASDGRALGALAGRRKRLEEALASIARRREASVEGPAPKAIGSATDPDSRVMRDKEGRRKPNYNAQSAVDSARGVIVAGDVNDEPEDSGQLAVMVSQVEANCGGIPGEVSADSGYSTGPGLAALESGGVRGYVAAGGEPSYPTTSASRALAAVQSGGALRDGQGDDLPRDGQGRMTKACFRYDAEADVYRCPMGQALRFVRTSGVRRRWGTARRRQYGGCGACGSCPRVSMCCKDPGKGRIINRDQYEPHRERMRARMETEVGRERYGLRRQTVEPRFGTLKTTFGLRRFLRRGLDGVRTEYVTACTALNIGILLGHWQEVCVVL